MSEIRVQFNKRRDPGVVFGRTIPQALVLVVAAGFGVFFVRSWQGVDGTNWWLLAAGILLIPIGYLRVFGRGLADIGPALLLNTLLGSQREYRGGPHRRASANARKRPATGEAGLDEEWVELPGTLAKLRYAAYSAGDSVGEVGAVHDRVDGTVTIVLRVVGQSFPLADTSQANAHVLGFQRMLNGLVGGDTPVVGIQLLNRVIPDQGEEAAREWVRRGARGPAFSQAVNEALLNSEAGRGVEHREYVAIRVDPRRARAAVKEAGGGDAGAVAVAFREGSRIQSDLKAAGVTPLGWLPSRGIAAVLRSAFDPKSDSMVARRGGGLGDSVGGDGGLPSGVAPDAAGPMWAAPHRKMYWHNDHVSRTWWIQEFPRSRQGVVAGFLHPLILGVYARHSVSILLEPLTYREAVRGIDQASSTDEAKRAMNRKMKRRSDKSQQREEQDLHRVEDALVDGAGIYKVTMVVTLTASTPQELEAQSALVEAALNSCSMEAQTWYVETDQAFYMGALPLVRGIG